MSVKEEAVKRAIAMLHAAGAKFKILHDGNEYGDLVLAPPAPERPKRVIVNNFRSTGYIEKIKALQPGETVSFDCPSPDQFVSFRACISSQAIKTHGVGNCITHSVEAKQTIELLRIS